MKKIIYVGPLLSMMAMLTVGCEKDPDLKKAINPTHSSSENQQFRLIDGSGDVKQELRAFFWTDGILNCPNPGTGCIVGSSFISAEETHDITVAQALKLLESGDSYLNDYFIYNDLRELFPNFYEVDFFKNMISGESTLFFEFPYLQVLDGDGELTMVYNYESTISDQEIATTIRHHGGGQLFRIQVYTGPKSAVWQCTSPGSNCRISALSINADWMANNPELMGLPLDETDIKQTKVSHSSDGSQIMVETNSGEHYGLVL